MMMNKTLEAIAKRFNVEINPKGPINLPTADRTEMAKFLNELGVKKGVEVGVAQGWHSLILCENLPGVELCGVDVWDLYDGYNEYTDRIHRYYLEAQDKMKPYPNYQFIKKFSMDAVKDFEDGSLDFVYIDGAHDFKNVADDICEWSKKVKRDGGIVYGHDYKRRHQRWIVDVKDVVDAYSYDKRVRPLFTLNTHNLRHEGGLSWMFVRQMDDIVNYNYVRQPDGSYKEVYL